MTKRETTLYDHYIMALEELESSANEVEYGMNLATVKAIELQNHEDFRALEREVRGALALGNKEESSG